MWALIKSLPALIGLLREIWDAFSDAKSAYEKKKRTEEMKEAIKDAKEKGDTRKLEELLGVDRAAANNSGDK